MRFLGNKNYIDTIMTIMLWVIMLSVIMLSVIMLSVIMLSVIMLSVIMPSVIALCVVAFWVYVVMLLTQHFCDFKLLCLCDTIAGEYLLKGMDQYG